MWTNASCYTSGGTFINVYIYILGDTLLDGSAMEKDLEVWIDQTQYGASPRYGSSQSL